ncbi:MAG: YggT family protein [Culicoidibacterales bacterium]
MPSLVLEFLIWLLNIYNYGLIIYVLSSWIPPIHQIVLRYLGPFYRKPLAIVGKILPPIGMMDFSPILLFFAIQIAAQLLFVVFSFIF